MPQRTPSLPRALLFALAAVTLLAAGLAARGPQGPRTARAPTGAPSEGCVRCHAGIEEMHPGVGLTCVDCHGGDGAARTKREAHVASLTADSKDERVAPRAENLAWRRFRNPMDLRVAETTCGGCHADMVKHLFSSLHGTTAGHLSDGYYEMGLLEQKGSPYGVFPVYSHEAEAGDVEELVQVPLYRGQGDRGRLATHYGDLARKECMQCHLWSEGRAVRGRVGFDGDYRGEGCAACHVEYALDGLSETLDRHVSKVEPGHPRVHAMTRTPPTSTCTSCHYGDASIGLHFRGLSQLPPGATGGPDIPGTTDQRLNRTYYLDDPSMVPPDVHHEAGMHCIDCHTLGDVMGDGKLWGAMELAVEISCQDCHGTFTEEATLRTQRGTRLDHLRRVDDRVVLTSKVTGEEHDVPQAARVVTEGTDEHNPHAALAMTEAHADLECYTCHAGWNVNFLGFHFDRNESLTQLDLLSGLRTPGRVTTQEKVFSTWKSFYAGLNESGRVAPYLTGFSTMGTVRDRDGEIVIDQEMPVTASGLSGMTMVHHQLHSTRPTARSCVECHRTSTTWGLGSPNFRLGRRLAFVADRRGIEVVALQRAQLSASVPIAKIVLPDVVDLELDCEPLQGAATRLFATEGYRGLHEIDLANPAEPRRAAFVATVNPRGMALAGDHLYVADGVGGLRVFDVSSPGAPRAVGSLPMFDAHEVVVRWPYAYVADGPGGLSIVDVRRPAAPKLVGGTRLTTNEASVDAAIGLDVLFQYSRPRAEDDEPIDERTRARNLCAVLDESEGLYLIDVTEPTHPELLYPRPSERETRSRRRDSLAYRGLVLGSHVELAEPQGGERTRELDVAYLLAERTLRNGESRSTVVTVDVSDPSRPERLGQTAGGYATEQLVRATFYNPPFPQEFVLSPGELGVFVTDVSDTKEPRQVGVLSGIRGAYVVAVEEFPLDKMLDEAGRPLKDVSHAGSRWMRIDEIERVLSVSGRDLGTVAPGTPPTRIPGGTARLSFARLDADRSGVLDGAELERAFGFEDENGDGRILLSELASAAGLRGPPRTRAIQEGAPVFLETRVDPEGDLSRLLDGTNPFSFDADGSRSLDRAEMERAAFAALDLDDDDRLTFDELSRYPGALRALRYRGPWAAARFAALDDTADGFVSLREFQLADRDFEALDADGDGVCHLGRPNHPWLEARGFVGPQSEWPRRQVDASGLPPFVTAEAILGRFDADGNGELSRRELQSRSDLYEELDRDGNERADAAELAARVDRVSQRGVDMTADRFLERWDLDRDGRLEAGELPPIVEAWWQRRTGRPVR